MSVVFRERNLHHFSAGRFCEVAERGERRRRENELLARAEKCLGGHAQDFARTAAEDDLLTLHLMQRSELVDQRVVFGARIAIACGSGFAQDLENFIGWTVRILVAIEKYGLGGVDFTGGGSREVPPQRNLHG